MSYEAAVAVVLRDSIEGGYSNNPNDRGGPTNRGMSLRAVSALDRDKRLPLFLKAEFDVDNDGDIDALDVPGWTHETALKFYRQFYWEPIQGDALPWPVGMLVFDSAVNEGIVSAILHLQRTVRVPEDGMLGPQTLAAVRRLSRDAGELLLRQFCVHRLDRYRTLSDAGIFFKGWAGRVLDTYVEALKESA